MEQVTDSLRLSLPLSLLFPLSCQASPCLSSLSFLIPPFAPLFSLSLLGLLSGLETENESESEVTQSCLTLCNPMDCSPPGSSVHGILQARILEWVAISFSRGSSQPRDRTQVSRIAGRPFNL